MTTISKTPWIVLDAGVSSYTIRDSDAWSIATVWTKRGNYRPTEESDKQGYLNALLMAAAPEMYDALSAIEASDNGLSFLSVEIRDLMRTALAKARGRDAT
jgi:hypothetical protein